MPGAIGENILDGQMIRGMPRSRDAVPLNEGVARRNEAVVDDLGPQTVGIDVGGNGLAGEQCRYDGSCEWGVRIVPGKDARLGRTGIPVAVVSADVNSGRIDRLLKAGAFQYLTKPLDVQALLTLLDDFRNQTLEAAVKNVTAA